jgi:NADH-quinone oxidoreductase subunit M
MLSSIGVPGLNGFVGEFMILMGTFLTARWWAVVAATGVILAALYLLWAYQRTFHGEPDDENRAHMTDLGIRERIAIAPLLVLIVLIGVYPKPFLERIDPSVKALIAHIEDRTDAREPDVAKNGGMVEAASGEASK